MTSSLAARPGQAVDLAALTINAPPIPSPVATLNPNSSRDRETQLLKRIRDLEEEVRAVRIENEKQVRIFIAFVWTMLLTIRLTESDDCEIPRALG